jgi:hypothetical protein
VYILELKEEGLFMWCILKEDKKEYKKLKRNLRTAIPVTPTERPFSVAVHWQTSRICSEIGAAIKEILLLLGGRRLMFADLYIQAREMCCGLLSVGHDPDSAQP